MAPHPSESGYNIPATYKEDQASMHFTIPKYFMGFAIDVPIDETTTHSKSKQPFGQPVVKGLIVNFLQTDIYE